MTLLARAATALSILAATASVSGCFLVHGRDGDEERPSRPSPDASASDPTDPPGPGRPPSPLGDGGTRRPPDAATFVPPDAELPIESPREDLTCDTGDEELLSLCGELPTLYVAPGGTSGATGAPDDPHASVEEAFDACPRTGCRVRAAVGSYVVAGSLSIPDCAWFSGGWEAVDGEWTHAGGRSTIVATGADGLFWSSGRMLVEHVSIEGAHTAISAGGDLLVVRDVDIDAEYSGVSASGARNVRICRARIVAGYEGISLSRGTTDVVIEDVDIDAGYAGVGLSWGSSTVVIRGSTIRGDHEAVGLSWGSSDVLIEDSSLESENNGLSLSWESSNVVVTGTEVRGCREPVEATWDSWGVKIGADSELDDCD